MLNRLRMCIKNQEIVRSADRIAAGMNYIVKSIIISIFTFTVSARMVKPVGSDLGSLLMGLLSTH